MTDAQEERGPGRDLSVQLHGWLSKKAALTDSQMWKAEPDEVCEDDEGRRGSPDSFRQIEAETLLITDRNRDGGGGGRLRLSAASAVVFGDLFL